ncbi:hypothetical protein BJ165DRAFT_1464332 [Panaeolus papilionaceus]|nr:hypothetical protein BJ165DRAFT_1464332 [Panaeolus papilionaceus]
MTSLAPMFTPKITLHFEWLTDGLQIHIIWTRISHCQPFRNVNPSTKYSIMSGIGYTPDPRNPESDPITQGQNLPINARQQDYAEGDGTEFMPGRFPTSPKESATKHSQQHTTESAQSSWSDPPNKENELSPHPADPSSTDQATKNGTLIDQSTEGLDISNQLLDAQQGRDTGRKEPSQFSEDAWGVEEGAGRDSLNA